MRYLSWRGHSEQAARSSSSPGVNRLKQLLKGKASPKAEPIDLSNIISDEFVKIGSGSIDHTSRRSSEPQTLSERAKVDDEIKKSDSVEKKRADTDQHPVARQRERPGALFLLDDDIVVDEEKVKGGDDANARTGRVEDSDSDKEDEEIDDTPGAENDGGLKGSIIESYHGSQLLTMPHVQREIRSCKTTENNAGEEGLTSNNPENKPVTSLQRSYGRYRNSKGETSGEGKAGSHFIPREDDTDWKEALTRRGSVPVKQSKKRRNRKFKLAVQDAPFFQMGYFTAGTA